LLGEGKGERGKEEVSSQGSGVLFLILAGDVCFSVLFFLSFFLSPSFFSLEATGFSLVSPSPLFSLVLF